MRSQWNSDEQGALYGLTMLAQLIYLRVFRWRMDYITGVAGGDGRKIGYRAIMEAVEFVPDYGSQKPAWKPTKGEMRSAINELKRAGLVQDKGSNRVVGLLFKCVLADSDDSAKNRNDTGTTHKQSSVSDTGDYININNLEPGSDTGATQERHVRSNTPPLSVVNNSVAEHGANTTRGRVDRSHMLRCLSDLSFNHMQVHTPGVMAMLDKWVSEGVSVDDIVDLVQMLRRRNPKKRFGPAYLQKPMEEYRNYLYNLMGNHHDEAHSSVFNDRDRDSYAESLFGSRDPGARVDNPVMGEDGRQVWSGLDQQMEGFQDASARSGGMASRVRKVQ